MVDKNGYVSDVSDNLVRGVSLLDFESELNQGDGNELKEKFRAAHSSSALAVNVFAPFKDEAKRANLRLAGVRGFDRPCFEQKCPHGIAGRRSPNLDLVARTKNSVVAVESKCLEPLTPHAAKFSPAYEAAIVDQRRQSAWFQEMLRLVQQPRSYRWLDAAQLIKHAYGLAYTYADCSVTLLYLYWEPSNAGAHETFAAHRAEIDRFSTAVRGSGPKFAAMSYPELWREWARESQPIWLKDHVAQLRLRYEVAV